MGMGSIAARRGEVGIPDRSGTAHLRKVTLSLQTIFQCTRIKINTVLYEFVVQVMLLLRYGMT